MIPYDYTPNPNRFAITPEAQEAMDRVRAQLARGETTLEEVQETARRATEVFGALWNGEVDYRANPELTSYRDTAWLQALRTAVDQRWGLRPGMDALTLEMEIEWQVLANAGELREIREGETANYVPRLNALIEQRLAAMDERRRQAPIQYPPGSLLDLIERLGDTPGPIYANRPTTEQTGTYQPEPTRLVEPPEPGGDARGREATREIPNPPDQQGQRRFEKIPSWAVSPGRDSSPDHGQAAGTPREQ